MKFNITKQGCKSVPILFFAIGQDKGLTMAASKHAAKLRVNGVSILGNKA